MASHRVLLPLCVAAGLACTNDGGPDEDADARSDEDSGAHDADGGLPTDASAVDLDASEAATSWLPAQCEGVVSPLLHPVCLAALSEACAAHEAERDCASQVTLNINDYEFRCGWARVISFVDASTCQGARSTSRCIAAFFERLRGCGNPCRDPTSMRSPFSYTATDELIERPCGPSGGYFAVGTDVIGECESGPVYALCGCAAAACAAQ